MQKEERFSVDCNKNVVLEISNKTAINRRFLV